MRRDIGQINIKLDKDFRKQANKLIRKYGDKMAELNGFAGKQLGYTEFIDNFVDKQTVADASIDGNANVGTKDICSLLSEMNKPHSKLLAFNKIYYELKKKYGKQEANKWLQDEWVGRSYMHDAYSSSTKPYCYAYDIDPLVNRGLFFVERFNAQPPKHLTTFTDFVSEFVSYTSNRTSGACGLPSFLIYSFYFWKKDCESGYCISNPEYYRDQEFQRIIYKLNQPYLRVNQSAFTNFSIFDRPYLEALFGGKEYPDGSFIIDYIDDLIDYQKHFMKIVSKIRTENVMTFPVLTYALLRKDGKFVDEDFAKWCCEHNMKWGDSNFFISDNVTSLSNCCFSGDTEVLVKSHSKVYLDTLKNLSSPEYASARRDMTVFHNGSWMAAKLIKLPKRQMYKVTTSNNKEIVVTDNHIHPTLQGDKATTDLTTDDYIMFNCRTLDTYPECDRKLTYEQGFLIGMYLGDGSISKSVVNLSLNAEKYSKSIDIINRALRDYKIEATPRLGNEYNKVYPVTITSNALVDAIREWVGGAYANVKTLNLDCLTQSRAFRGGILDGYYLTDGGNSNRIYTTSKKLTKQIEALCTSLGKHTIIDMSDRTNEPVVIRGSVYKRSYPLYCIRWYEDVNKRTYKNIYEVRNNSTYFKVTSIEPVKYDDEFVYCFEMQRDMEPYFTLPNGMITHNCRLVSDIDNLG